MPDAPSTPSAPPAAPAAASSQNPVSAPPSGGQSGGESPPSKDVSLVDSWAKEIQAMDKDATPEDKPKPANKEAKQTEPDQTEAPKDQTKTEEKPGLKPDEPEHKPVKAAQLRERYDAVIKEKNEVLMPEIQRLKSRIKELETGTPDEVKRLNERIAAAEKRRDELEQHIGFVDFQKSKEFQEKFAVPYQEAWTRAVQDFSQLKVKIPDGQDEVSGEPKFKTRQATADDLLYLANLDLSQMDEQAQALFGTSAPRVIRHVEKVRELSDAQSRALEDAQKRTGEWLKSRQTESTALHKKQIELWGEYNSQIAKRFPEMFGQVEGDTEGNALLQKGFALADRLFAPTKETAPKTLEEKVQLHALMRHRIANHDRLVLRLKRMTKELDETKKALADYEHSAPPGGKTGAAKPAAKSFSDESFAELDRMAAQGGL